MARDIHTESENARINHLAESAVVGAAGEYYVAAELSRRGWAACITPHNVSRTDVLAQRLSGRLPLTVAVQVKTRGDGQQAWKLHKADEALTDAGNEWYVFVSYYEPAMYPTSKRLLALNPNPQFFVVPRNYVAPLIYCAHQEWLSQPRKDGKPRKDTPLREIRRDDIDQFRDAWDLLAKPTQVAKRDLPDRVRSLLKRYDMAGAYSALSGMPAPG